MKKILLIVCLAALSACGDSSTAIDNSVVNDPAIVDCEQVLGNSEVAVRCPGEPNDNPRYDDGTYK